MIVLFSSLFGEIVELGEYSPYLISFSYFNGPTLRLYEIMDKETIPESNFCLRIESLCSPRSLLWT